MGGRAISYTRWAVYDFLVTLQCDDAPGIVHAATNAIVAVGGNIVENDQFTDPTAHRFCMRTRFECASNDVAAVRERLAAELAPFDARLVVRLESDQHRALVLASTTDHCLGELFYRRGHGDLPLEIVAVASNHPTVAPLVARYDVPFFEIPVTRDTRDASEAAIRELIDEYRVDYVILARYMQVLSPAFCEDFPERVINIHHSFLPGFKGARPYHQAYERGVKLIGATAHFVTADLDAGPIIEQDVVRVSHARTPEDLASIGRDVERTVLARAVRLVAEDRVTVVGQRTVIFSQ